MTAISYATAPDPRTLPFKDRRTSLKVVGVLLLVFGGLCGCFAAMTPIGMLATTYLAQQTPPGSLPRASPERPDLHTMVLAAATYLLMAAAFIWLGIGAVRIRRWARPVMLVVGWTWLATGVASLVHYVAFGVNMREAMTAGAPAGTPPPPPAVVYAVTAVAGVVRLVLFVLLPALLVWAFQRRGVRETLAFFDPRVAWTDRCPTPVLAVAAWLVLAAAGALVYSVYRVLPVFGYFIKGAPAVAALVALAAVFLWVAWAVYRLRAWAWWATAILWTVWAGSMVWTFTSTGYHEFYRQAGYSGREIDMMMRFSGTFEDQMVWMIALWSIALIGYLLYVRKYFSAGPAPEPAGQAASEPATGPEAAAPMPPPATPAAG